MSSSLYSATSFKFALKEATRFYFAVFLTFALIRSIELYLMSSVQYVERKAFVFLDGLSHDSLLVLALFTIHLIIHRVKFLKTVMKAIAYLFLLIALIAAFYFEISLQLLDRTFLQFSMGELSTIVTTFGEFKGYYLLPFIVVPLPFLLDKFFKRIQFRSKLFIGVLILLVILNAGLSTVSKSNFEEMIVENKASFFVQDLAEYTFESKEESKIVFNDSYPLIRQVSEENPLGSFFVKKAEKPNLVFVIVESLSSSFSGPLSREISFTPFLDSLAQHSLYFTNFISTTERTFGVLPSAFASLPHGRYGFSKTQLNMPYHASMIKDLKKHGYNTSFFYGGDASYDNMRVFLENNNIDIIYDHQEYTFDDTNNGSTQNEDGYGVDDKQLFEEGSQHWDDIPEGFAHIYLTVSMHYPFKFDNQEYYLERTRKRIEKEANAKGLKKEKYLSSLKVFSSCMFTDDALKKLISLYKDKGLYDNTIFFIFGDHALVPVPKANHLEAYRTALYIHSPLLKKPKTIQAINSHLDLTPSVLNLLWKNYNLSRSETVHWLGEPFDTSSNTTGSRKVVLMRNNRTADEILYDNYVVIYNKLHTIDPNLDVDVIENDSLLSRILYFRDSIKSVHQYAVENNKILESKEAYTISKKQQFNGMVFSPDEEYVGLLEYDLEKKDKAFILEVDFELENAENASLTQESPLLVVRIKNESGETYYWEKSTFRTDSVGQRSRTSFTKLFQPNSNLPIHKGDNIKIFLWNVKKTESPIEIKKGVIQIKSEV